MSGNSYANIWQECYKCPMVYPTTKKVIIYNSKFFNLTKRNEISAFDDVRRNTHKKVSVK